MNSPRKQEKDKFRGKDSQFDGIHLNPNGENEDPPDLSDDPMEENISDEELDVDNTTGTSFRRSICVRK